MGIYIVKSKVANYYKIGHHKVTQRRPNVYFRWIRRGFYSCKHPEILNGKLSFEDIELLFWFPNLDIEIEQKIHAHLKLSYASKSVGEWYEDLDLIEVVNIITNTYNGINKFPSEKDLNLAIEWKEVIDANS